MFFKAATQLCHLSVKTNKQKATGNTLNRYGYFKT